MLREVKVYKLSELCRIIQKVNLKTEFCITFLFVTVNSVLQACIYILAGRRFLCLPANIFQVRAFSYRPASLFMTCEAKTFEWESFDIFTACCISVYWAL